MVFTRYKLTDQLILIGEVQDFVSDAQANYQAFIAGMQFNFWIQDFMPRKHGVFSVLPCFRGN